MNALLLNEVRAAVARHKYDVLDDGCGIWLPKARSEVRAGGVFSHRLNDGPWVNDPNLLPTQGLNAMLDIALGAVAKATNWYMAPFAANVAPTATLTAANFSATQTEFTNYSEVTRSLWTPAAAASGSVNNTAAPVSITVANGAQTSMYGLALLSASAKGATTGSLMACTLFASPRTGLQNLDSLGLRYTITLTST